MKPFIGIFDGNIKKGKVLLPDMPDKLIGIQFHLAAVDYTYLKIIPNNNLRPLNERENHERQITYIGTVRSDKNGSLFIPKKARILSGLNFTGDVVIVGLAEYIEIWNKKNWNSFVKSAKNAVKTLDKKMKEWGFL